MRGFAWTARRARRNAPERSFQPHTRGLSAEKALGRWHVRDSFQVEALGMLVIEDALHAGMLVHAEIISC